MPEFIRTLIMPDEFQFEIVYIIETVGNGNIKLKLGSRRKYVRYMLAKLHQTNVVCYEILNTRVFNTLQSNGSSIKKNTLVAQNIS